MLTKELKQKIAKKLKAAYDNAWRKEPVWEKRKEAGREARKLAQEEINERVYNWLRSQECH